MSVNIAKERAYLISIASLWQIKQKEGKSESIIYQCMSKTYIQSKISVYEKCLNIYITNRIYYIYKMCIKHYICICNIYKIKNQNKLKDSVCGIPEYTLSSQTNLYFFSIKQHLLYKLNSVLPQYLISKILQYDLKNNDKKKSLYYLVLSREFSDSFEYANVSIFKDATTRLGTLLVLHQLNNLQSLTRKYTNNKKTQVKHHEKHM